MKYHVEKNSGTSIYMQIYRQLKQDILSGLLPKGKKLPSKRSLAEELGVSLISVEQAYGLLIDEGYVSSRERSGYFADFGGAPTGSSRSSLELMSVSSSEPPEDFPFSVLAKTMRKVLSEQGSNILIKSPNCGCPELRNALSAYLERSRGISVEPERIIIGSGAEYLYSLAAQLMGRGSSIALEEPCYDKIRKVYEANGIHCPRLSLGADGIDSPELEQCRAAALHVTPFSSYPSGISASAAKQHEYARWAESATAYIIEDDYDSEFASPTKQVETLLSISPERVIYINTFSKTLAPSMRMGYMILPEKLLSEYKMRFGFYSCTVPVFEQLVLAEFINNGDLERYINRRRRKRLL